MAGGPGGLDQRDEGVAVAVVAQLPHALDVARGLALVPDLVAAAAVEVDLAGLEREPQRLLVHVGERQHLARARVLHHARHEPALVEADRVASHAACGASRDRRRVEAELALGRSPVRVRVRPAATQPALIRRPRTREQMKTARAEGEGKVFGRERRRWRSYYSIPSRSSSPSSRRQWLADPDLEVEEDLARRARARARGARRCRSRAPSAPLADQDPLLRLGLGPDLGPDLDQAVLALGRPRRPRPRPRAGSPPGSGAGPARGSARPGAPRSAGRVRSLGRIQQRPLGSSSASRSTSASSPAPVLALTGKTSSTTLELGGRGEHRARSRRGGSRSTLLTAQTTGVVAAVAREQRLGDEAVAGADALARR